MTEQHEKKRWRDMTTSEKIEQRKKELKELQQQERKENRKARDHRLYFVAATLENLLHEKVDKKLFLGGKNGDQFDKQLISENELKQQLIKYANQLAGDESRQTNSPMPDWLNGMNEQKFHVMQNQAKMFQLLCLLMNTKITKDTAPNDLAGRLRGLNTRTLGEAYQQRQNEHQKG